MSNLAVNAADRERLLAAYPEVFHRSVMQRWGLAIAAVAVFVYLAFCFSFFNVIPTFVNGNWDRAAIYLQDWYSWRAQPRLRFQNGRGRAAMDEPRAISRRRGDRLAETDLQWRLHGDLR
jgi:phosphonate transport system permease protein